jgi:hypothetical protein
MMAELLILPLHYSGPTLTPEALFHTTFWVLTLPMFVAMIGVFLSRRIDLNIEISDSVKLIIPLLYTGLIWFLWSQNTGVIVVEFIFSPVYGDIYRAGVEFGVTVFILLIPSVLGFLQACLSYPDRNGLYEVVFVFILVASWGFILTVLYEQVVISAGNPAHLTSVSSVLSIVRLFGALVLITSPIAYFAFLTYIYRGSSESESFLDSVPMPCLLVTVIYSPLFLLSFVMFV